MIAGVRTPVGKTSASRVAVAARGAVGRSEQPAIAMTRAVIAVGTTQVLGNIETPNRFSYLQDGPARDGPTRLL